MLVDLESESRLFLILITVELVTVRNRIEISTMVLPVPYTTEGHAKLLICPRQPQPTKNKHCAWKGKPLMIM